MNASRGSHACRIGLAAPTGLAPIAGRPAAAACSPIASRLAPVLGGALLALALAWPSAAGAAAPAAGADTAPPERVLDVSLVPVPTRGAAAAKETRRPREPPALTPGAAARLSRPGRARSGSSSTGLAWLAAAMAGAAAALVAWRRWPRRCASCRGAMRRIGREEAFAALDMAERTEQLVGDVRYEVWSCAACGAIEKRGKARDLRGAANLAVAAPVGSAAFLRRRARAGLSIWSPPASPPAPGPWPAAAASPAIGPDASRTGDRSPAADLQRPADG